MNIFFKSSFVLLGVLWHTVGLAQKLEVESSFSASGYLSTENELPFWMVANHNGALSSQTDGLFQVATEGTYFLSENNKASFTAGASLYLRNGVVVEDRVQRNELYLQFENSWLKATAGAKNPMDRFQGLSVVNDNFLMSGNARAISGILLETAKPISLLKNISIEGGIGHYELNDDRFVRDAMLHYKKLYANWKIDNKSQLRFGVEHYAQWGGTSPTRGKQPSDFNAFIDIFFAKESNDDTATVGDSINALGNHLGIYNLEYIRKIETGVLKFYHQHPFEDGSGTALKNFPDGIWGLYFKPNREDYTGFLDGILVEYVQTTNQSKSAFTEEIGADNYFNNGTYNSGWTYEDRVIGLPFINPILRKQTKGFFFNNRVRTINLGLSASLKKWSFLTKHTYSENLGSYSIPLETKQKSFYGKLSTSYSLEKYGTVSLILGFDYSNLKPENYGAGLTYSYRF